MTIGNAVASTVSVAGVAPPDITRECAKLDEKNKDVRKKVVDQLDQWSKEETNRSGRTNPGLIKEEVNTLNKATGTGMTISSAKSLVPGAVGIFSGCSSGCAQACTDDLVGGGTSEQKVGLKKEIRKSGSSEHDKAKNLAGVLCGKSHVHPGGGYGAHAEPKIINHMSNIPFSEMEGGSILFSIDWRSKTYGYSGMPCPHCYAMMCHAEKVCQIKIYICDKDMNPQPLALGDCADEDAYSKLSKRVDGNEKPGRKPEADGGFEPSNKKIKLG